MKRERIGKNQSLFRGFFFGDRNKEMHKTFQKED